MKLLQDVLYIDITQNEKRFPGCIALVIFSSNRTGYHPRSQQS